MSELDLQPPPGTEVRMRWRDDWVPATVAKTRGGDLVDLIVANVAEAYTLSVGHCDSGWRHIVELPHGKPPTGLLDRLLWHRDADGEWVHRLADEWDGNAEGHRWYEKYDGDHRNTSFTTGINWTTWGFGPLFDYAHESSWNEASRRYLPTKRIYLTVWLGPLYVAWMWVRPRKGFDPR